MSLLHHDSTIKRYLAVITKVYGTFTGTPPRGDPTTTKYDAVAVEPGIQMQLTNHLPKRRISFGAKVIPAEVNDPCDIVVVNGVPFLHVFEGIPFIESCP